MRKSPLIGFVHIPKTGGTTMKFVLRNSFGWRHCDVLTLRPDRIFSDEELRFVRRFYPGLRSIAGLHIKPYARSISDPIDYFTFLRDPVTRCASHFQQQLRRGSRVKNWTRVDAGTPKLRYSLEEFLEHRGNHQTRRIAGRVDLDQALEELHGKYFAVGLTEDFALSLRIFERLCPYELDLRYSARKVAPDDTVKKALLDDRDTRQLIAQANAVDQQLYDYVRNTLFPAQLAKAGLGGSAEKLEPLGGDARRYTRRYVASRAYRNGVYRQALKLRKRWLRRESVDPDRDC